MISRRRFLQTALAGGFASIAGIATLAVPPVMAGAKRYPVRN